MSAICPQCNVVYDQSKKFCGKCGVPLNPFTSAPPTAVDVAIPSAQIESISLQPQSYSRSNPAVIAVIALLVAGIGYFGYTQFAARNTNPVPATSKLPRNESPSTKTPGNDSLSPATKTESPEEIQNFLNGWGQLQTSKNINGYLALYASDFRGVKRTVTGKTTSYNYQEWVLDRRQMYQKGENISVTADNVGITNYDNANGVITVEFMQHYNSSSYSDLGRKQMKLRREGISYKIVYEEMLDSQKVENPAADPSNMLSDAPATVGVSDVETAIKNFYQAVQDKRVNDAVNMFSAAKRPNIKVNLISSVAKDTEYYAIDSISINSNDGQTANTLVRLRHKKFKRSEELWEINVTLVNEEGIWKIVSTPGNKVR